MEQNGNQSVEFFFEVTNSGDYLKEKELKGTHSFEFNDICWVGKGDEKEIMPKQIQDYLNYGTIISDTVRFIEN